MTSTPKDQTDPVSKPARDSGRERSKLLSGKLKPGHTADSTPLDTLRKLHIREYQENTFEGTTEWVGTVVKNPFLLNPNPVEGDYPVRVRVRIEKLHKGLPLIKNKTDCQTQDLYPEFVAESLDTVGGEQPTVGQLVKVKFIDRHQTTLKYSNGLIVSKVDGRGNVISGLKDSPLAQLIKKKCIGRKKPVTEPPKGEKQPDPGEPVDPPTDTEGEEKKPKPLEQVRTLEEFRANPDVPCDEQALLQDLEKAIASTVAGDLEKIKKLIWYDTAGNPIARRISKLHPLIRMDVANLFKIIADEHQIPLMISSGYRTIADQERILRGTHHGTPGRGGASYHNYGFAIDVRMSVPALKKDGYKKFKKWWVYGGSRPYLQPWVFKKIAFQTTDGKKLNEDNKHRYMEIVANAFKDNKLYGSRFEWGQYFTTPDLPHFQRRPMMPGNKGQYPAGGAGARLLLQRIVQGHVDEDGYVIPGDPTNLQKRAGTK